MSRNVLKFSRDLVTDPWMNKGSAFTEEERSKFRMRGLFPARVETMQDQIRREDAMIDSKEVPGAAVGSPEAKEANLEKYVHLMDLLARNETLFYKLVCSNIKKFMPLVYTPTVGYACEKFSDIWSSPKGLYITRPKRYNRRENLATLRKTLSNWKTRDVKAIVFTDGERILGLGDLGINGMGIPIGKLQLYSACAGIKPSQCLPVCIDNGTNTKRYLEHDLYMGKKEKRRNDKEYYAFISDFMESCTKVFGRSVLLQFEDFGNSTAFDLLNQNQYKYNCFNDDIQGTACVALAGVLAALRIDGVESDLSKHKVLFLGAGEAGTGIGDLVAYAVQKITKGKITQQNARDNNIFFVDSKGLISTARKDKLAHHKEIFKKGTDFVCKDFLEAVHHLKPTMIVGVSAQPNKFTEDVCRAMAKYNEKPIIFALSNPTSKCECTAAQAYKWTDNRAIFASGSPFPEVRDSSGHVKFRPGQGNNAYIFPGIALGVIAAQARFIPEDLFYLTAATLADMVAASDLKVGSVYPPLEDIRKVSLKIAVEVAYACFHDLPDPRSKGKKVRLARAQAPPGGVNDKKALEKWIEPMMDKNDYKPMQ